MPIKAAITVLAMLTLAACASDDAASSAANMALACQTMNCACVKESGSLLRKDKFTAVLWKTNGDAYCPKGFALKNSAKK